MNEKKVKILTTIGKVAGILTAIGGKAEFLPPKFAWVGVVVVIAASTAKDAMMMLGDLWDDGKINKSYNP